MRAGVSGAERTGFGELRVVLEKFPCYISGSVQIQMVIIAVQYLAVHRHRANLG